MAGIKNQWTETIEAMRDALKARDELNAALMEENAVLKQRYHVVAKQLFLLNLAIGHVTEKNLD